MTCGRTLAWPALKTSELKTPELRTPELRTPELRTPELRTPALRSCRECERFRLDRALPPPAEGSTVGDRSTASREPGAPTALGRAGAPHYRRRPGRGSRPRPPSSRFHGFDPHEPNGPVPRIGVDSLTFSMNRCGPLAGESSNRRKSEKRTPLTYAGGSSVCTAATPSGRQKLRQMLGASPTTANQPSQLDVCTSLQSSPAQVD